MNLDGALCIQRAPRALPTTLTSLNGDILANFFRMLSPLGSFDLMSTCRYLFQVGLPVLLAHSFDRLWGYTLICFYDFLSFFAPTNFLSLRGITFEGGVGDLTKFTYVVADILDRAVNLRTLRVHRHDAWKDCEEIIEGITSLSKLQDLHLLAEDARNFRPILEGLQAPLVRLRLERVDENIQPMPLLHNFCNTLENVHLDNLDLSSDPPTFSCPKVTRLVLSHCSKPDLSVLIPTFPNVQVLSLYSGDGDISDRDERHETLREKNVAYQCTASWRSLTSLTADDISLYTLGLQNELDSFTMPTPMSFPMPIGYDWLHSSLQLLKPRHLKLICFDIMMCLEHAAIEGTERLERLDLVIDPHDWPLKHALEDILIYLQGLSIQMLNCDFVASEQMPLNPELLAPDSMEQFARRALEAAPTLDYILIEVSIRPCYRRCWIVVEEGTELQLQEVHSDSEMLEMRRLFIPPVHYRIHNINWSTWPPTH